MCHYVFLWSTGRCITLAVSVLTCRFLIIIQCSEFDVRTNLWSTWTDVAFWWRLWTDFTHLWRGLNQITQIWNVSFTTWLTDGLDMVLNLKHRIYFSVPWQWFRYFCRGVTLLSNFRDLKFDVLRVERTSRVLKVQRFDFASTWHWLG